MVSDCSEQCHQSWSLKRNWKPKDTSGKSLRTYVAEVVSMEVWCSHLQAYVDYCWGNGTKPAPDEHEAVVESLRIPAFWTFKTPMTRWYHVTLYTTIVTPWILKKAYSGDGCRVSSFNHQISSWTVRVRTEMIRPSLKLEYCVDSVWNSSHVSSWL